MGALMAHGGCGTVPAELLGVRRNGVEEAAEAARAVLEAGGSALDAVEEAVRLMEDNPVFNAGTGSVVTLYGEVEMDASVMTSELECGAVAAVKGIQNPVRLARRVMECTDHVLLVGEGANLFASLMGIPPYDPLTTERKARWEAIRSQMERDSTQTQEAEELDAWKRMKTYLARYLSREERRLHSTVGAVAIDSKKRMAVATSTGGMWFKLPGRVGDTPVIGAGSYASEHGAASATGHGEGIIRLCLARRAVHHMASCGAQQAVDLAVDEASRAGVECGLIAVDAQGRLGSAHNTPTMPIAHRGNGISSKGQLLDAE